MEKTKTKKVAPASKVVKEEKKFESWVGRIPKLKPGKYADGIPYSDITYLAFKLILKSNRFISRDSLFEFQEVIRKPAKKNGVGFKTKRFSKKAIKIREVLFVDTPDFKLYNNAFILRRRISYEDGFPAEDPEIVFKFRHTDLQKTAEVDIRPNIQGDHNIKFKCQVLPLKDELGGIRILYSHNVQFSRSSVKQNDVFAFDVIAQIFPALKSLKQKPGERIELVNGTVIEEVLQDIGEFDFGGGMVAKANVAIWRTRGEHRPLIGEFAYQLNFEDRSKLNSEALKRAENFFIDLQYAAKNWIALNATKTGVVYRMLGNAPKAHE